MGVMRKSRAPSNRQARKKADLQEKIPTITDSAEDDFSWGTGSGQCSSLSSWKTKQHDAYDSLLKSKRIFNIVWRDITTKKIKTWKGDGTFEVNINAEKGVLKDETGKYLGSCSKIKINCLEEGFELTVGGKEIQILDEINSIDKLENLKKQQFDNRCWGEEECLKEEPNVKKPKGAFIFKCPLNLNKPQLQIKRAFTKRFEEDEDNSSNETKKLKIETKADINECLLLLRPSELQAFLLEKVKENYQRFDCSSMNGVLEVLQIICNHPSLLNQMETSNHFSELLQTFLPDWCDMGPFDSTKLEFLEKFLLSSVCERNEKTIIIASEEKTLNMLQGFCDFLNIPTLQLNKSLQPNKMQECDAIITNFNNMIGGSTLLMQPMDLSLDVQEISNLIFFNCLTKSFNLSSKVKNNKTSINSYQLITAGCYEEFLYESILLKENLIGQGEKALEITDDLPIENYLHSLNSLDNDDTSTEWKFFAVPFSERIIEDFNLQNVNDNLVAMFCRQ